MEPHHWFSSSRSQIENENLQNSMKSRARYRDVASMSMLHSHLQATNPRSIESSVWRPSQAYTPFSNRLFHSISFRFSFCLDEGSSRCLYVGRLMKTFPLPCILTSFWLRMKNKPKLASGRKFPSNIGRIYSRGEVVIMEAMLIFLNMELKSGRGLFDCDSPWSDFFGAFSDFAGYRVSDTASPSGTVKCGE